LVVGKVAAVILRRRQGQMAEAAAAAVEGIILQEPAPGGKGITADPQPGMAVAVVVQVRQVVPILMASAATVQHPALQDRRLLMLEAAVDQQGQPRLVALVVVERALLHQVGMEGMAQTISAVAVVGLGFPSVGTVG